jgi:flagellar motor switch protein FliG
VTTASPPQGSIRSHELSGPKKVAILLMALGEEASSAVTRRLPPEEVEAISYEIARMDQVAPEIAEAVLVEWKETERAVQFVSEGGTDYARRVLVKAFGESRAREVLTRIEAQLSETLTLAPLRKADPQQVAALIRSEHPQSMALVLVHLPPAQAGEVLRELSTDMGGDVLLRMARMEKILPDVLKVVEGVMGAGNQISFAESSSAGGGPESVAGILNELTGGMDKELLDQIAEADSELSQSIKDLMFVFEDILNLDDQAVTRVLREVETQELALALKVASDPLKDRILSAMTGRARDALTEEMEFLGPVRMRDVEEAQGRVVSTVRQLEEEGEIVISGGGDVLVE